MSCDCGHVSLDCPRRKRKRKRKIKLKTIDKIK